ncbi:MAG: hypothetical protein M1828_003538 [Chrysothrix sp. TS-e1954]|nr:MAG: hypothetical protein M1828_003538 [Chrysothrix sp. TS-e1954]
MRLKALRNVSHFLAVQRSHSTRGSQQAAKDNSTRGDKFVKLRLKELGGAETSSRLFPRWRAPSEGSILTTCKRFREDYSDIGDGDIELFPDQVLTDHKRTVYGRVIARRKQGAHLAFLDIGDNAFKVQGVLKAAELDKHTFQGLLSNHLRTIKIGDWIALTGHPHQTSTGELSVLATEPPLLLAPALQPIPEATLVTPNQHASHRRHTDDVVDPTIYEVSVVRHQILHSIRSYLNALDFLEVTTPLLASSSGGANARPFSTYATEFSDLSLDLRISPELFLKRMIVQGHPRVYELGPVFRNEGIDSTHNPEFTICEFYQMMTSLPDLIDMTESLVQKLSDDVEAVSETHRLCSLPAKRPEFDFPFKQLQFIPTLQSVVREHIPSWTFPDCSEPANATYSLRSVLSHLRIDIPRNATLPALLDALCSHLIEPLCKEPHWITHHPACMSPLAKSFTHIHDSNEHEVSARAELFINSREYVNCYEEENDPFEQRRKFRLQNFYRLPEQYNEPPTLDSLRNQYPVDTDDRLGEIDEDYINYLQHGMPSTGGWGCGVDRLVMLFAGRERMSHVLPFGTLNNVVGMGRTGGRATKTQVKET